MKYMDTPEYHSARAIEAQLAARGTPQEVLERLLRRGQREEPGREWEVLLRRERCFLPDAESMRGWLAELLRTVRSYGALNAVCLRLTSQRHGPDCLFAMLYDSFDPSAVELTGQSVYPSARHEESTRWEWCPEELADLAASRPRGNSQRALRYTALSSDAALGCMAKLAQQTLGGMDPKLILGKSRWRFFLAAVHAPVVLGLVTPRGWRALRPGETPSQMLKEEAEGGG